MIQKHLINFEKLLPQSYFLCCRSLTMFRFTKEQIRQLVVALTLPQTFEANIRIRWDAEEGLCVVLRRLAYPCRLVDLVLLFG